MTDVLAEDEDTEESRSSWLQHQHTKKRLHAQREEVEMLKRKLLAVAMGSQDAEVRQIAVLVTTAEKLVLVFQGKD